MCIYMYSELKRTKGKYMHHWPTNYYNTIVDSFAHISDKK